MSKIIVTGAAGFIGYHLSKRLLKEGWEVIGIDNLNDYYDVNLKNARLNILKNIPAFKFYKASLEDQSTISNIFKTEKPDYVVNLAAQAGVRHSISHPQDYISSNIQGFLNILEGCRNNNVKHLIYASSSSVYGANRKLPFSTSDNIDHPLSLYAATKKSNELMAHSYAHLYNLPSTGLRFFSVYGPYGRPDMALFIFTKAILEGKPIDVYNNGDMKRDFTYIDDIVEGVYRLIDKIPKGEDSWDAMNPDPAKSNYPYRIFNIGNNNPVELSYYIELLEGYLGVKAKKNPLPLQPGDVVENYADVNDLQEVTGFKPKTTIENGMNKFVNWYKEYYRI